MIQSQSGQRKEEDKEDENQTKDSSTIMERIHEDKFSVADIKEKPIEQKDQPSLSNPESKMRI